MEDSWENWISCLDTDGEDSFNRFVDIEENCRDSTKQQTLSSKTDTQTDSLYPSSLETEDSKCEQFGGHCWHHLSSESSLVGNLNIESSRARAKQARKRTRSSSETQDHIMSERKRRHEMAQRFIALSAIIPGLKKIDKASVLGEAINYVKQLQERLAALEQESEKKGTKTMIIAKKSRPRSASRETNSNNYLGSNQVLPEVEAIGLELEKEVLIRVHCEKRRGIWFKLLALLENMHLSLARSSVLPFGKNTLNITIIAQIGEKYNVTVNELVKNLRQDLLKLYDTQP